MFLWNIAVTSLAEVWIEMSDSSLHPLRSIVLRGNIRNSEEKSSPNPAASALELIPNNNESEAKPVCFEIEFYEEDGEEHKFKIHYELQIDLGTFLEEEYQRKILAEVLEVNGELIDILPDFQLDAIDYKRFFSAMTKLIRTNIYWKENQHTAYQIKERNKQSYRIAIGLLLLKIKQKESISMEEKNVIEEYFKALQEYYLSSNVLAVIEKVLLENLEQKHEKSNQEKDIYASMEEKIWLYSEEDIMLLQIFYLEISRMKFAIEKTEKFKVFSKSVYKMVVYRVINIEISNIMSILGLLYALVVNNISTEYEKNVLFINLPRLMEKTAIRVEDFEKEARNKINCRVEICVIAREYYKSGERNNNLLEWRKLTENMDEFVEIRNIEFE